MTSISPTSLGSPPDTDPAGETPAPSSDAEALAAAKRAKAEKIGRYVAMFLMPLLMVSMLVGGYLAAMHAPTPNDMPIAVTGSGPQADRFADALEAADPDAVDVRVVGSDAEARQLVLDREVSGAVSLNEGTASVYTASAAGASQSSTVTALLAPQVLGQGLALQAEDLAPLPDHDMAGLGAMFLTTALMLAGYMPLSLVLSNSPELLRFRRFVPLLAGWAALIAGLVWAVTGPMLGVVEGHSAAVLGISWLTVFAVGSVQLFLTRILGPMAVLAGMLFLMVLGVPASNMSMSVHTMPGLYPYLHSFLPAAATGESLRSFLYFDGNGAGPHLLVLVIGAVAALLLTLVLDAVKRRRKPNAAPPAINVASLHGGPRPKTRRWRYGTLAFFPLAMVTMMLSFMLGAMYEPTPRDMPVAVVGSTAEQAEQAVSGLDENMSGLFDLRPMDNADDARDQVRDRTVVGAYVLPSAESPSATLITNEAGGMSQQQVLTSVFGQVSAGQQMEMAHDNVAPLKDSDSMGMATMYLAMGWIMAGFMIIVVGSTAAPASRPLRMLLPIVAAWAVGMSAFLWVIADVFVGAIDGHFLPLWGAGAVAIFCVAMFTTVFERFMGMLAILPTIGILMFLGVPASGAAMSIYMEPEIFRFLHEVLPMPAAVESIRSILYFGSDTVWSHLLTLGIWGAASLAVVAVIDHFKPPRTEGHPVDAGVPAEQERVPVGV
ncbi:ABC transporter permease [Arthrobacter sp. zg-Y1171]|uniref:ABC transporter permease n=1 Tax=Arthrobacter sp. zg-Y1171 TaxID=2964610 RepID=UPI0021044E43|nr:ABC transporter permease [Arthrobacter sp. zg-Y1171]MCQ1995673.1 ABC transporter permease [Arthrobacter sp. zg-Y1171]UWX83239.1 ABC transporter permease [Arthrobacter sp. zg-Y1171]